MDERTYMAIVLREANRFMDSRGETLGRALREGATPDDVAPDFLGPLEEQLKAVLVEVDHIEDVLKHSPTRDLPAEAWRSAETWQEALTAAALAALERDVLERSCDIARGAIPRMENIQLF